MFSQGSYNSHRSVTDLTRRRKSESLQGGRFGLQWWMAQKDGTQGREIPAEHHGQHFLLACRAHLPSLLHPRVCTMLYRDRPHTIQQLKPLFLLSPAPNATRLRESENKSRQLFPSLCILVCYLGQGGVSYMLQQSLRRTGMEDEKKTQLCFKG